MLASESASRDLTTVEARSFSWRTRYGAKKAALFRTYRSVAVLQHTRTTFANRGRGESTCTINESPRLQDVNGDVLSELRGEGYDVVADVNRIAAVSGCRQ